MFTVHRFISKYHNSNTYIIDFGLGGVVIVDPGDPKPTEIINWLKKYSCKIDTIILTHEHSDHCIGVKYFAELYEFNLIWLSACARNIKDPKQNFSFYIGEIPTFSLDMEPIIVQDNQQIDILGNMFRILEIPGHSPGSMLIILDNVAFTGDSLLNGIKTPLIFPHSNKILYKQSYEKIKGEVKGKLIYPGHCMLTSYLYDIRFYKEKWKG